MASALRFGGAVSSPVAQSAATRKQPQTERACLCSLGSKSENSIARIQSRNVTIGLPSLLQQSMLHSVVVARRSRSFQCAAEDASAEPSAAPPKEAKAAPNAAAKEAPEAATKPAAELSKKPTFSMKKGQIVRVDKEKYLNSIEYYAVAHPKFYKGIDYIYEDRGEILDLRNFEAGEYALITWAGIPTAPAWLPTSMLIKSEKLSYKRT